MSIEYSGENILTRLLTLLGNKFNTKVDKEQGKGLSTNDFTNALKSKLEGLDGTSGGSSGVQPDWNQNDPDEPDYVKNRPFYEGDPELTTLMEETTITFQSGQAVSPVPIDLVEGETYIVTWDNVEYECVCQNVRGTMLFIGNTVGIGEQDNGLPFIYATMSGQCMWMSILGASTAVVSVQGIIVPVNQIPEKYLPIATEENYGLVTTSQFAKIYRFSYEVPVLELLNAINEFNDGKALIIWNSRFVIHIDTRTFVNKEGQVVRVYFADQPRVAYDLDQMGSGETVYYMLSEAPYSGATGTYGNKTFYDLYANVLYMSRGSQNTLMSLTWKNFLPMASASNNGQIAQIVNGEWTSVPLSDITDAVIDALPIYNGEVTP